MVRHRGSSESTPLPTQQHLAPAFPPPLAGNVEKVPLLVTLVCPPPPHCLSPAPGTLQEGDGVVGAFLLSQPLLQSWAAASASILSPTMCLRRQVVRTAEPRSSRGRGPATHVPGNFPFSLLGWCRLRAGWTSCFFLFPVQAATGAVGTGMVW